MDRMIAFAAGFVSCVLLVCAIGWLARVKAEDWAVATCCSYHFDRHGQNQDNLGIGFEHRASERWAAIGGYYKNSLYRDTFYAGGMFTPWRSGALGFGLTLGLATGYTSYPIPLVVPTLSIEGDRVGVNLLYMPVVSGGVAGLQFKVRF